MKKAYCTNKKDLPYERKDLKRKREEKDTQSNENEARRRMQMLAFCDKTNERLNK